jgi:hypothetical protein
MGECDLLVVVGVEVEVEMFGVFVVGIVVVVGRAVVGMGCLSVVMRRMRLDLGMGS